MTLLMVLGESGHISSVEEFKTHGLAAQKARDYTEAGKTCRIVPDELKKDVEYLMTQLKEKRENGFVRESGAVPNGMRSKGEGARGLGRMIYPAFGGKLEGEPVRIGTNGLQEQQRQKVTSVPLTSSSKILRFPSEKIVDDDLIIRRNQ